MNHEQLKDAHIAALREILKDAHIAALREIVEQRAELKRLRGVLLHLCHEVAGTLYMRQYQIRNVIGNTNFACLEQRMREAEQSVVPKE